MMTMSWMSILLKSMISTIMNIIIINIMNILISDIMDPAIIDIMDIIFDVILNIKSIMNIIVIDSSIFNSVNDENIKICQNKTRCPRS